MAQNKDLVKSTFSLQLKTEREQCKGKKVNIIFWSVLSQFSAWKILSYLGLCQNCLSIQLVNVLRHEGIKLWTNSL